MKGYFHRRQRFSLRKYSIGVCLQEQRSLRRAQSASADEATAALNLREQQRFRSSTNSALNRVVKQKHQLLLG